MLSETMGKETNEALTDLLSKCRTHVADVQFSLEHVHNTTSRGDYIAVNKFIKIAIIIFITILIIEVMIVS